MLEWVADRLRMGTNELSSDEGVLYAERDSATRGMTNDEYALALESLRILATQADEAGI